MPADHYRARTLPQVVAEAAATWGKRIAVTDGEVRLSYEQLDAARIRTARAFIAAGTRAAASSFNSCSRRAAMSWRSMLCSEGTCGAQVVAFAAALAAASLACS